MRVAPFSFIKLKSKGKSQNSKCTGGEFVHPDKQQGKIKKFRLVLTFDLNF